MEEKNGEEDVWMTLKRKKREEKCRADRDDSKDTRKENKVRG